MQRARIPDTDPAGFYTYSATAGKQLHATKEEQYAAWESIKNDARSRYWYHSGCGFNRIPGYS